MTRNFLPLPRLTLVTVLLASSATAQADPGAAANIPEPSTNSDATARSPSSSEPLELPLPYTPWQGTGPAPPTTPLRPDLPLPEARPRQRPRRPLELSAGLGAFLPSCGSGTIDDRDCRSARPGSGAELSVLYRAHPFFAVGGAAALGGFGGSGSGALSLGAPRAQFLGVTGRVYFADDGRWDPYLALTLGVGSLTLKSDSTHTDVATSGFGGRVAGGVDYLLGSHLRLGPTVSLAHWLTYREPASYGRLLGFATLELCLTASLGAVL